MPTQTTPTIPRQRCKPRGKTFTSAAAREAAQKRWAATLDERTQRRIDELVAAAPPLSDEARAKLAALLAPAVQAVRES